MWAYHSLVGQFILVLTGNRYEPLVNPPCKLTGYFAIIISLIYTVTYIGVHLYVIYDSEDSNTDDSNIADVDKSESGACAEKDYVYRGISGEEANCMEEVWR